MSTFVLLVQAAIGLFLFRQIVLAFRRVKTVRLRGPLSEGFVFGITKKVAAAPDSGAVYEAWAETYGPVYEVSGPLGTKRIVICDPKAVAHVYALDSWKYGHTPIARRLLSRLTGPNGLLSTLGEEHKRQRRILNPVFGPKAVKSYTTIFFDAGYKVKNAWDTIIQSGGSDEAIIDVSDWMDHVSLDVIGLAAFSHDFRTLLGNTPAVSETLTALGNSKPPPLTIMIMLLAQALPILLKLPMPRNVQIAQLKESMGEITDNLLKKARVDGNHDQSAMGVLLNAESTELTEADVRGHMRGLLLAGYETTSVSLKWALLDLSMNPDKQDKLRAELKPFTKVDPTYDDFTNGLPYLDAVVREVIRLHPLDETTRVALEDDIIPLSQPIVTASGTTIDRLSVAKGTMVSIPIHSINRAASIWGKDCKTFVPERWLTQDGVPQRANEFPGYHHTLTFLEGPRTCLGKGFALAEIKAVLAVLISNYVFMPRDGPGTQYGKARRIAFHPKVAGEEGSRLPIRVRRVE